MGQRGDFRDRVQLSHHVGAMRKTDEADVFIQEGLKIGGVQMTGLRVDRPFADLDPLVRQATPGAGVGFVVLIGDDDRLTRLHELTKRLRQNIGVLGCGGAKAQLFGGNPHYSGEAAARIVHFSARQLGGGIGRIGLDLAFDIVAIEPVDHRLAGVRAPRVFKEGLAPKAVGAECRELTADKVDIEGHDHSIHFAEKISAALPHAGQGLR